MCGLVAYNIFAWSPCIQYFMLMGLHCLLIFSAEKIQENQLLFPIFMMMHNGLLCLYLCKPQTNFMKVQNILIGVLSAGLIGSYVLHFTGGKTENVTPSGTTSGEISNRVGGIQILYVQADSIMENFAMMQDLDEKFRADNSIRESKLMDSKARFERKLREYEQKLPTLTTRERGKWEEELQQMQARLMQDNQELSQLAAMQEAQMINQVYDSLHTYFAELGEKLEADYILAAQKTSGVLYANPRLDITGEAIEHINSRYAHSKQ